MRTCKHLQRVLGPDFDRWRVCNAPGAETVEQEQEQIAIGKVSAADVEKYAKLYLQDHPEIRPVAADSKLFSPVVEKKKRKLKAKKPKPKKLKKEPAPKLILANKWNEDKQDPSNYWVSEKYDGLRAFWDGTKFLSRNGNPFYAPAFFTAGLPTDVTLDGELYMGRKMFEETSSIVKTQSSADERWNSIVFMVFDIPSMDSKPFEKRYRWLNKHLAHVQFVQVVEQKKAKSKAHVLELRDQMVAAGGEGLMLRKPKSVYVGKRTHDLLKVKKWIDDEAEVIGHVPGKGRHKGRMGALECRMLSNNKQFRIGTGFNDAQREDPPQVGDVVTFKYQELTKAMIPRFPVYLRPAEDYHVEK